MFIIIYLLLYIYYHIFVITHFLYAYYILIDKTLLYSKPLY